MLVRHGPFEFRERRDFEGNHFPGLVILKKVVGDASEKNKIFGVKFILVFVHLSEYIIM